jgi:hypothetical protein
MEKDWTGNARSTFSTLGASSHSSHERETNDYYATDPRCAKQAYEYGFTSNNVWEPACGEGHLSKELVRMGLAVRCSDTVDRGCGAQMLNFLEQTEQFDGDILTNPPYKYAQEFVEKALELIPAGRRVFMFLKLTFLEGQKRRGMFERHPPRHVLVYSQRQKCAMNGDFENTGSSAAAYAWFVWEKGYQGATEIKWI